MKKEWIYQERWTRFGGSDWFTAETYNDEDKARQDWGAIVKIGVDARLIERTIEERIIASFYDDKTR